ncbi:MAG: tRNA (adenosine(37)-N6)-dimethylallyltransferase MiaA [Candidatus Omnitrophota bacterium]
MNNKPLVIFLVGATASGKSEIALKLARKINAEIISADSMQVYKGMNILSAQPSPGQRKQVKHYLIDVLALGQEYSAAKFREQALVCIEKIIHKKKIPLIVGGTGLYIKALTQGLFAEIGKDIALREKLYAQAKEKGNEYLYKKLKKIDPGSAKKIHLNDLRRIVRAIEAYRVNKIPLSKLKTQIKGLEEQYQVLIFGINQPRQELYRRIEQRIDQMIKRGLVKEVKKIKNKQLSQTAAQALGLKQISAYLNREIDLKTAVDRLKRDTRRFAKRQLTWFRQDKSIIWLDSGPGISSVQISQKIISFLPKS